MKQIYIILLFLFTAHTLPIRGQIMNWETYCFPDTTSSIIKQKSLMSSVVYKSSNGARFKPTGTIRALTIGVNIIYDQTPNANPAPSQNSVWPQATSEGINQNIPPYLLELYDTDISNSYTGSVSRLYAESSFYQLHLLSDFIIVNIKQSTITPTHASFDYSKLMNSVISFINANGGLNSIYGHNSIADYDNTISGSYGQPKDGVDGKIDLVNFLVRNSSANYGTLKIGSGYSYITPSQTIKINNSFYGYNTGTCQCVGDGNFANAKKNILTHEVAHLFLGGNEFHTSGGVTDNDTYRNTFIGGQYGYGLFAGGLSTCNGYERWRLGWSGPSNNAYSIAASNMNSDITKFEGEKTFLLRDFVTYGDAIRIKLPYKDSDLASNQYIWLENHQCGKNNKLDNHQTSAANTCREVDRAGIYAYYQVGKDVLESSINQNVFPSNEKDNLRTIYSEGHYNVEYKGLYEDCFFWSGGVGRPRFEYTTPNVFNGVNNQTEVMLPFENENRLAYRNSFQLLGSKVKHGIIQDNLPWLGDGYASAFIPTTREGKVFDISSNPSAVNTTTYYNTRNTSFTVTDISRNNNKIYLTGLSVKMIDEEPQNTGMKTYTVKIRWDDYDVKQDVYWTGNIVLKERLILLPNKTIVLEQNRTPKQIDRDAVTGYFAKPTFLTCEEGSMLYTQNNSSIIVKENSSLVAEKGSEINIDNGSLIVKSGSTLQIKSGASLYLYGNGKIIIEQGGYLCIEQGANIHLADHRCVIFLEEGAILGANPSLFPNPSCLSNITFNGGGSIIDGSIDIYIQNETISRDRYFGGRNIYVGNNVTNTKPTGNVVIKNGADVIFDASGNVFLEAGFEVESGAYFEIK